MDKSKLCPTCGEELQTCEECGRTGCPECDLGWNNTWYRNEDGIYLCPKCYAEARGEYNCDTENGTKVCGSCALFEDEDAEGDGWCAFHQEPRRCADYCGERIGK